MFYVRTNRPSDLTVDGLETVDLCGTLAEAVVKRDALIRSGVLSWIVDTDGVLIGADYGKADGVRAYMVEVVAGDGQVVYQGWSDDKAGKICQRLLARGDNGAEFRYVPVMIVYGDRWERVDQ